MEILFFLFSFKYISFKQYTRGNLLDIKIAIITKYTSQYQLKENFMVYLLKGKKLNCDYIIFWNKNEMRWNI